MKKGLCTIITVIFLVTTLMTSHQAANAENKQQTLRIAVTELPSTLGVATMHDTVQRSISKALHEGLVSLNDKGQATAAIAESWSLSEDRKTYIFNIRSNAKWSNGKQVQASDFVFGWKQVLDRKEINDFAFLMNDIENAEYYYNGKINDFSKVGIKALSPTQLQIKLSKPTSYFLQKLAEPVFAPVYPLLQADGSWDLPSNFVVSDGAFMVKQFSSTQLTLVPNPNYYNEAKVNLKHVQFIVVENPKTAYLKKKVDWISSSYGFNYNWGDIEVDLGKEIQLFPVSTTYYYMFNINKKPFNNLKIRKALSIAIDRNNVDGDLPAYGFVSHGIHGISSDFRTEVPDKDYSKLTIKQARILLKQGLQEEGLSKLPTVEVKTNDDFIDYDIAEDIADDWSKQLGISVEVKEVSWAQLLAERQKSKFQVAKGSWNADYDDPSTFLDVFASWNSDNDTGWKNKTYDSYLQQARYASSVIEQNNYYKKAETLLMDQAIIVPLYYYNGYTLGQSKLMNMYVEYDGTLNFNTGYMK